VAEFLDTAIKNTLNDIEVEYKKSNGQMSLFTQKLNLGYQSYVRDEDDLADMKKSLENHSIPRRRFDFVIGNPPYVSYNECSKAGLLTFKLIKDKASKIKLNDIYGMNLHSIPNHRKKYSPKPNLYAFFIALGIALLKDGAKICYIVPQTLLTAGDLDVLRYHLAKFTTLEKIITFSGKMFIGRGLKQDKPVATSSLVFVASRRTPDIAHEVEVINYKNPDDDIEKCLSNILAYNHKEIDYRKILQNKLLQNVANWNFIKQDKKTLDFCEEYKKNTDDILIYYDHATAEHYLKSRFYFDKGLVFPKNSIKKTIADSNYFNLVKLQNGRYGATLNGKVIQEKNIKIPHGSQGIELFRKKYKILWSYMNYNGFHFSDEKIMVNFNFVIISSDNKKELLYLLSLLNSSLITYLFNTLLKSENEKDILIGIKTIKELKTVEDKVRKLYLKTGRRLEIHPIIETKEAFCFREEILAREAKYPEIYQVADFGLGDFTQEMNLPSPPLVLKDKLLQSYIIDFSKTALYYGVHFIVGPFWGLTKKADLEELKKECYFLKDYAVKGRVAIHPGHINIINNIFSKYSAQDINKAHKIISAYQKAAKLNKLPLVINKKYIGLPEYKRCLNIISELKT